MATPLSSKLSPEITQDIVLEAFFLHALLRRCQYDNILLSVPHCGDQAHRLDAALDVANRRMAATGQPQYGHACNRCMKVVKDENGNPKGK
ncbi:hypothetical protein BDZ89DRAFT_956953 [Hymenopellis radicata]|nr:hypothetical protein BDZ89DRAFT_956953 [Hymenopellis radicata]